MSDYDARHIPVLPELVMALLSPAEGETVLDATVGLAGHARMMADRLGPSGTLIGLDHDESSLAAARDRLEGVSCRVILQRSNFRDFDAVLDGLGIDGVDVMLADLGLSSMQLADANRGFSFQNDGPLDMRMDDSLETKAADLINALREDELGDLIFFNSQEKFSRKIARAICQKRRDGRITTTAELSRVVSGVLRVNPDSRKSKIHPATRVFQALRIAVNDEKGALADLLEKAPRYLNPGARFGVIAFHSLEDGPVKHDFRKRKAADQYEILTKRPLIAGPEERDVNPRSRSAKLRVVKRKREGGGEPG